MIKFLVSVLIAVISVLKFTDSLRAGVDHGNPGPGLALESREYYHMDLNLQIRLESDWIVQSKPDSVRVNILDGIVGHQDNFEIGKGEIPSGYKVCHEEKFGNAGLTLTWHSSDNCQNPKGLEIFKSILKNSKLIQFNHKSRKQK